MNYLKTFLWTQP